MDLKEEAVLGDSIHDHWYYLSKARMMASHVDRCQSVLDVGAGSGFFSRWLLRKGRAERAICVDPGYEAEREESEEGRPIRFRQSIESSDADLVLMMDVLEHVDDDVGLLSSYAELLEPGARVLITVPAFEFIWSAHDEFLEHRRRYTLKRLRRTVADAGLSEVSGHYYFGAVFPLAVVVRLLGRARKAERSDMKPAHPVLNRILRGICSAERRAMRINRMAGLSVVMLCQR